MSRFVGVVRTDGAPVAAGLIEDFTASLVSHQVDAGGAWQGGQAALGRTEQADAGGARRRDQPVNNAGGVWIVADARIDARAELVAKLHGTDPELSVASDDALILRAYMQWGETCVDHLIGDFSFAVWDARTCRLFCARDQMGVKPFYFAQCGPWLIVSTVLDCVRRHPAVSDTLDDLAISDYLLFGSNQASGTTVYGDIKRLPAAHTLMWSASGLAIGRYWSLPIDEPVYYKKQREYSERFENVLKSAVQDRLPPDRVSIFMSGGLDSTLLAATARRLMPGTVERVQARTFVYDHLIQDPERRVALLAARHLGISLRFTVLDGRIAWRGADEAGTPEPMDIPSSRQAQRRCYAEMAEHSAVALYGEGPDNALLFEWQPHLRHLLAQGRWARLVGDVANHIRSHRRVPLLSRITQILRQHPASDPGEELPGWLEPGLVNRLKLRERWQQMAVIAPSPHPTRPAAHASLQSPLWQGLFEAFDPAYTGANLEVRHPYMDVRVLRFMLSVPALPWCRRKQLLRSAGRGVLPLEVLSRGKVALTDDPHLATARRIGLPSITPSNALAAYVDVGRLNHSSSATAASVYDTLRVAAVSQWLAARESGSVIGENRKVYELTA